MLVMRKYQRLRNWSAYAALLALSLTGACSHRLSLDSTDGTSQTDSRDLPFHGDTEADSPADSASHPAVPAPRSSSRSVPFKSSASSTVPAGTLLTVRLENTLTSAKPLAGKTFVATVEEPVTVEGRTLIPRDAEVKGRVESAHISNVKRRSGYLRLTLDSIQFAGKETPLPTSSLFARGTIDDEGDSAAAAGRPTPPQLRTVRLRKGRALTFRLTADVDLSKPSAVEDKPQPGTK